MMRLPRCSVALLAVAATVPSPASARTHQVSIDKMKFSSMPQGVRKGDRIVWVNRDMFRHTATSAQGGFDLDLAASARGVSVMRSAGTFLVVCRYHPGMVATLNVKE